MPRKKSTAPYVVRWRDAMLNDSRVKAQGRLAGMALTIYAKVNTGHDCYPSAQQCAKKMDVSVSTIERGWAQLKSAGWLQVQQLPPGAERAGGGRSALKRLTFPQGGVESEAAKDEPSPTCQCGDPVWLGTAYCQKHYGGQGL